MEVTGPAAPEADIRIWAVSDEMPDFFPKVLGLWGAVTEEIDGRQVLYPIPQTFLQACDLTGRPDEKNFPSILEVCFQ